MLKAFIVLDPSSSMVLGHRAGFLDNPTPGANEIEVPYEGFDYKQYEFKKYDAVKQQFISDDATNFASQAALSNTPTMPVFIFPIQFKQLFTLQERVAIKTLQQQDILVQEFNSILDDPRTAAIDLRSSDTQTYLDYLVTKQIINSARKQQVLDNIKP